MNYFEAAAELKKGRLAKLYLICGEESYLAERLEKEIFYKALPDGTKDDIIYLNESASLDELAQKVQSVPFFTEKNLIIAKNSAFLKEKQEGDRLLSILNSIPDYSVVVLVLPVKADRRRKLYKLAEKSGAAIEVGLFRAWEVKDWLLPRLKDEGRQMERAAADYFLSLASMMDKISLGYLEQELQKIFLYTDKKTISLSDVKVTLASCPAVSIFALSDAIGEKNIKKALSLLKAQLDSGEHPLRLLALLTRQVRQLWQVKELERLGSRVIAKQLGLVPFIAEKLARASRNFSAADLKKALLSLDECDYLFKSGQADTVRLEMILIELCR
jgi:DNA polymerase-3 subunit delta